MQGVVTELVSDDRQGRRFLKRKSSFWFISARGIGDDGSFLVGAITVIIVTQVEIVIA